MPQTSEKLVPHGSKVRVIFFGTPTFAASYLRGLLEDPRFTVAAVVTQPDEPIGRKKILTPPPVKKLAGEAGIPVFQPSKLKDEAFLQTLRELSPDVFVIVAYGRIMPEALLTLPPLQSVNVHPSLLPKYRGPSPMQAALAKGDKVTGVSIMKIDAEMDHGPILAQETIDISEKETVESLTEKVVALGDPLLRETLRAYAAGKILPIEQKHEEATYCKLLTREDGVINWDESAEAISNKIRAYNPWPGTSTTFMKNGESFNVKIFSVELTQEKLAPGEISLRGTDLFIGTGTMAVKILELQAAGSKQMSAQAFLQGNKDITR